MKILVVEDDAFSMKLTVAILERHGHEIRSAATARLALKVLERESGFDLIVSDVMMPHVDGFAMLRLLRSDRRLKRIPVILCTALGDADSVMMARELNVAGYVVKPVIEERLIEKVNAVQNLDAGAVLVVDDEDFVRQLLLQMLQREGWRVIAAASGKEAIEIVHKEKIRLVLSDIRMPNMDGFELLAFVKEHDPDIPVLLISGKSEYSRADVISAGADDFIAKPFRNTDVLLRVDALIDGSYRAAAEDRK